MQREREPSQQRASFYLFLPKKWAQLGVLMLFLILSLEDCDCETKKTKIFALQKSKFQTEGSRVASKKQTTQVKLTNTQGYNTPCFSLRKKSSKNLWWFLTVSSSWVSKAYSDISAHTVIIFSYNSIKIFFYMFLILNKKQHSKMKSRFGSVASCEDQVFWKNVCTYPHPLWLD